MTHDHTAGWWRRVLDAADGALDLAPDERAALIERYAGADPAFAAELSAILANADAESRFDTPAAEFAAPIVAQVAGDEAVSGKPQTIFGAYRIVRELGRGGMGAVYLAERFDRQFEKLVALKVLPAWSAIDTRRVQRFLDERRILASLEHPDIARLVDGGITPDGIPWFAMEYVDGVPIDRYCDDHRLSIGARLALFCRVCEAVQYAHRNLVVHRDLKPANILVTADGRVRLLDFGIAKLLGDEAARSELTATGEQLLTPLYASPEQIRGAPVSTATDVYALGVLLHVLLTGRYPYQLASWQPHEVARAVLEQDPIRPSVSLVRTNGQSRDGAAMPPPQQIAALRATTAAKLRRRLAVDLDTIVLKAVDKEPGRRYTTADQLEADVRRHLDGLPITARAGSRAYHARKFLRRHRVGATLAAGVVALGLAFTGVTAVQAARIRAQSARIAEERDKALRVADFLTSLFRGTTHSTSDRGLTARELLDSATARLDSERLPDPRIRARLMVDMARAYLSLDLPDQAKRLAERSLVLRRGTEPVQRVDVGESSRVLGEALAARGELVTAESAYAEALASARSDERARPRDVARALEGLATVKRRQARLVEAESLARSAVSIDQARRDDARSELAHSKSTLAHVLLDKGDHRAAARLFEDALALVRQTRVEEHADVAGAILSLATALKGAGDEARGDSLLRYGEALYQRLITSATLAEGRSVRQAGDAGAAASAFGTVMTPPPRGAPAHPPAPDVGQQGIADDSRIVFISDRDGPDPVGDLGTTEIYVMKSDGSDQQRLTHIGAVMDAAVLSPDGGRVAFATRQGDGMDIFVATIGDGRQQKLTNLSGLGAFKPAWSPDGRRIAFQTWLRPDIYIVGADGAGLVRITDDPARDIDPAWSPDGQRLAFVSARDGNPEIYTMDADGKNVVRLTFNDAPDLRPAWSPDGKHIAFQSDRDADRELYVMNADGTNPVRLTSNPGEDAHPAWSPDGRRIVFHRRVLGHAQIFVMNADGSNVKRLTELSTIAFSGFPTWGRARAPARSGTYHPDER